MCADEPPVRFGAVQDDRRELVEWGITTTAQRTSDRRIRDEVTGSADLVGTLRRGAGEWTIYVEGSTTPRDGGISNVLEEANADAATAVDGNDTGRVQISELHYSHWWGAKNLTAGLLDPTGFLDISDVANDETAQFLGASLVNNPTIEFPDYTLGAIYHQEPQAHAPGFTLVLAGSHGLAENDGSYSSLVDLGTDGKGLFGALELYTERAGHTQRLGIWINTADHEAFDGDASEEQNHGIYGTVDWPLGSGIVNLRLGLANPEVSRSQGFASAAYEFPGPRATIGLGVGHIWVSDQFQEAEPDRGDTVQAELYTRFDISNKMHISASVQWLRNSAFDHSESEFDADLIVLGLRLSAGSG